GRLSLGHRSAHQDPDEALEDDVEDRDVEAHDEADGEDEDRQVANLLARRPGDLLQFGPRFGDEASKATHVVGSTFGLCAGSGRGDRTRTYNRRFWRPVLCQLSYTPAGSRVTWPRDGGCDAGGADSVS